MDNKKKIGESILKIVDTFVKKDSKADKYGTDTKLHFSEIHMIKFIKENQGFHMARIAEEMDITKGAVSQTIGRLCKKGFLVKSISEDNKSKLVVSLTEKGELAYYNHQKNEEDFYNQISKLLDDEKAKDIQLISDFLEKLSKDMKI